MKFFGEQGDKLPTSLTQGSIR